MLSYAFEVLLLAICSCFFSANLNVATVTRRGMHKHLPSKVYLDLSDKYMLWQSAMMSFLLGYMYIRRS